MMVGDQQADQLVLGAIGVLVFVHQQVADTAPPVVEAFGMCAEQVDRPRDEIVEIHRVVGGEGALISGVNDRQTQLVPIACGGLCLLRGLQVAFPVRNALRGQIERRRVVDDLQLLKQVTAVVGVEQAEALAQPEQRELPAQDTESQVMKGGYGQALAGAPR